jgi:acyl-coenzyme A thioesterase PaaI-like protein
VTGDAWGDRPEPGQGGAEFAAFVEAVRRLLDFVTGTNPPAPVIAAARRTVDDLCATLEPYSAPESDTPAGARVDLPGRGHPLLAPLMVDELSGDELRGRVTFTRFHLGRGGAAHGGAIALLFDDVLGRMAHVDGTSRARTARLEVSYRQVTPIGTELAVESWVHHTEGRRRVVKGRLRRDGTVLAEAEGLFVALRADQP